MGNANGSRFGGLGMRAIKRLHVSILPAYDIIVPILAPPDDEVIDPPIFLFEGGQEMTILLFLLKNSFGDNGN